MTIREEIELLCDNAREASGKLALLSADDKNKILLQIANAIEKNTDKRYTVRLTAERADGMLMDVSLTVNSEAEAREIAENFERRPESVYRGLLLSATGRIEYLK